MDVPAGVSRLRCLLTATVAALVTPAIAVTQDTYRLVELDSDGYEEIVVDRKTESAKLLKSLNERTGGDSLGNRLEKTVAKRALGRFHANVGDSAAAQSALGLRAFFKLEHVSRTDENQSQEVRIASISLPLPDECLPSHEDDTTATATEERGLLAKNALHITRHTRADVTLFENYIKFPPILQVGSDVCFPTHKTPPSLIAFTERPGFMLAGVAAAGVHIR